jgi:queuine tRNA-ribosyltransferase
VSAFGYELLAQDGSARRGRVATAHGTAQTPGFMTVGTQGTVKGLTPEQLRATGAQIVLGNTYHLMLRPGAERIARLGGLHKFMQWPGPILTDSGGFQVMSLSELREISENGVAFRSHVDGSKHNLTPELATQIQHQLDSDIAMVLDECTPYPADEPAAESSMERSLRWAERCRKAFVPREGYALFGIVQGSVYPRLRLRSAAGLIETGFEGYAVGGLAVGEGQEIMFAMLDVTVPALPTDKPRYLMGAGRPLDIVGAVQRGIDLFDCVLPTRSGRTGQGFTRRGTINIRNARHQEDPRPVEEGCRCVACAGGFSRAYLHHLFKAGEMLGPILLTLHNLTRYQDLMAELRAAIAAGRLADYAAAAAEQEALGDVAPWSG